MPASNKQVKRKEGGDAKRVKMEPVAKALETNYPEVDPAAFMAQLGRVRGAQVHAGKSKVETKTHVRVTRIILPNAKSAYLKVYCYPIFTSDRPAKLAFIHSKKAKAMYNAFLAPGEKPISDKGTDRIPVNVPDLLLERGKSHGIVVSIHNPSPDTLANTVVGNRVTMVDLRYSIGTVYSDKAFAPEFGVTTQYADPYFEAKAVLGGVVNELPPCNTESIFDYDPLTYAAEYRKSMEGVDLTKSWFVEPNISLIPSCTPVLYKGFDAMLNNGDVMHDRDKGYAAVLEVEANNGSYKHKVFGSDDVYTPTIVGSVTLMQNGPPETSKTRVIKCKFGEDIVRKLGINPEYWANKTIAHTLLRGLVARVSGTISFKGSIELIESSEVSGSTILSTTWATLDPDMAATVKNACVTITPKDMVTLFSEDTSPSPDKAKVPSVLTGDDMKTGDVCNVTDYVEQNGSGDIANKFKKCTLYLLDATGANKPILEHHKMLDGVRKTGVAQTKIDMMKNLPKERWHVFAVHN